LTKTKTKTLPGTKTTLVLLKFVQIASGVLKILAVKRSDPGFGTKCVISVWTAMIFWTVRLYQWYLQCATRS